MSSEIVIPKLDWFERYKRLMDAAWASLQADEDWVFRNCSREQFVDFVRKTRPQWSGQVGKKLIEKCHVPADVQGAVQLLGLYSQEVWGFGDPKYFDMKMETPTRGVFVNLVCRGWEKEREHYKATQCDIACAAEYAGVIAALSPVLKVTVTKAFPRGDDRCEYTVEPR